MHNLFAYIIYSKEIDQYYVGHTGNLDDRIVRHTGSGSKATMKANDWMIVYKEHFVTRLEAYQREIEIKKKKSKKYIDRLISSVRERPA